MVEFDDADRGGLPSAKAFYRRWIIPPSEPWKTHADDGYSGRACTVAVTAKGSVVVHGWNLSFDPIAQDLFPEAYWFRVFPDFQAACADEKAHEGAREAFKRQGVPVEELDI